jgi:hypothetical protein
MQRSSLLWLVGGVVPMATALACGGSTTPYFTTSDPDAATGGSAGALGSDGGSVADGSGQGGSSFDPGAIGGLIGGAAEAGAAIADAGMADSGGAVSLEVIDGCNSLCAKDETANCPNQGTVQDCILGCRLFFNNPSCGAQTTALFACEKTSSASCDGAEKATLTQCPIEQLSAVTCFLQNARDPSLKDSCMTYCANVSAAHCPSDDIAGCPTSCQVVGNFIPACNAYWKQYVDCSLTSTFVCGPDGKASAGACGVEFAQYALCTLSGAVDKMP